MPFESKLQMEFMEGTVKYKLLSILLYRDWKGKLWSIPKDFSSDGHSIPGLLRSIAGSPFATIVAKASWLHDWLRKLAREGIISYSTADSKYSQALADEGWKGGPWRAFKRKRNYLAVRVGAGLGWISGLFKRRKKKLKKTNG